MVASTIKSQCQECTLKSTPIVAVEDSESNWSSQYLMSTVEQCNISIWGALNVGEGGMEREVRADLPAPEGPIRRIFNVGLDSSVVISTVVFRKRCKE